MLTLDDTSDFASGGITGAGPEALAKPATADVYGEQVDALLTAAAGSSLVRTQRLGTKAAEALDALSGALKREQRLNELANEMARLRRGED